MSAPERLPTTPWPRILWFYVLVLCATWVSRKLPNLIQILTAPFTDVPLTFDFNHGFATLIVAVAFYALDGGRKTITLFGDNWRKSLLFPIVLLVCYSSFGIGNRHGIDPHLWAIVFCSFSFAYNILEEYAWRGYLIDRLDTHRFWFKSLVSGVLWGAWHLLVLGDFEQYGGFAVFLVFCVLFSFLLTFATLKTRSIVVAAAMHAFVLRTNMAAAVCLGVFLVLLLTWDRAPFGRQGDRLAR